jgi:hypothetical protein
MPIDLSDIPTAVADYLDNHVTTTVSPMSSGGTVEAGESGTYSVTVTNAAAPDGVRLVNVRYHLTISPASVAKFSANGGVLTAQRATINPNDPPLATGTLVDELFVFPLAGVTKQAELDVGEVATIEGLKIEALDVGTATIKCHIHADVDQDSLFPTGENSPNGKRDFTVT